ncbi:MAG: FumA C-terminus/TtdB family hydratase beta subunit [Candidatus Altiarchaeales archaeon]|nr:FumA C-terminus/TtdB family hydratase beta subunit [Candidatus Altiarchaeota archaeon]MBU4406837.1 FumA C-terminus/TtdB family hydratase beta subunit [Candidatus Altiarchaeota archaeon]MCG2782589.1 FumA C-terminus/TtdB family hydratase beta subunit [Candidatus Altiarchaeales archaeon]
MNLRTPLSKEDILKLRTGDMVYISGEIVTARDKAHQKALKDGEFPVDIENGALFHAGPLAKKEGDGWKIVSIGPTTSSRMNSLEVDFIKKFKIFAIIGKGGMSPSVVDAMKGNCVYLSMTGGCAALAAKSIKAVKDVHWLELGVPEAVWVLEAKNLGPLVVAIDSEGNSIYKDEH